MVTDPIATDPIANREDLEEELRWFAQVLDLRFRAYLRPAPAPDQSDPTAGQAPDDPSSQQVALETRTLADLPPPSFGSSDSPWATFLRTHDLSLLERLAVVLSLAVHLCPRLLDVFYTKNAAFDRRFTEFGGVFQESGFEPSAETLMFILDGGSVAAYLAVADTLSPAGSLQRRNLVRPAPATPSAPPLKAPLRITPDALNLITTGRTLRPSLGAEFPAERIETKLQWGELILPETTRRRLEEVQTFIEHGDTLMNDWGMGDRLRPGYRALFYGPPGTGKTMSAALLGKLTNRDVYRVDLSLVVSKYIGETEKNLARVFDRAQSQQWILFFDEADALFGKRSETRDAHDRHANQEVAFLLQRIESFNGIAILASNLRENLDSAFARRFEAIIYFPIPRADERLELWRNAFSRKAVFESDVDLEAIARTYELTGGSITNIVRQVSMHAIAAGGRPICGEDLQHGIRQELSKEGRC